MTGRKVTSGKIKDTISLIFFGLNSKVIKKYPYEEESTYFGEKEWRKLIKFLNKRKDNK